MGAQIALWWGVFALVLVGCSNEPQVFECVNNVDSELRPLEEHDYIAHAGGSPRGLEQDPPYTNSREAFEASYKNGFRVFEFDMITLGDGTVVLAHHDAEEHYDLEIEFTDATRADLEGRRYDGSYELLFAEDLIELMVAYPDIWIIIDSKWDHEIIAQTLVDMAPNDAVRDRLVPHLKSAEHTQALVDIYPFPEQMIALYRWEGNDTAVIQRMSAYGVDNVMMWWDTRWSEQTQEDLSAAGLNVWVHTPTEDSVIESFLAKGVRVYSNGYISPCIVESPTPDGSV